MAAVGDDATVQDVVNGMFRDGHPIVPDAVLAVIPANSSCDLVKSFGLPSDAVDATAHLLGEETYPFDLMKLQSVSDGGEQTVRYAHNLAQIGFHAEATARTARLPERLGNARRFLGFWGAYVRTRPVDLAIDVDGRAHALRGWSLVIGNGQFADGGLRLSPRSFPGDGVMDALVFTGPKSDAYRMLPRIFRHGDHIPDPGIKELRTKLVLRVEAERRLPVVADGAYLGTTPVSIQMVPTPDPPEAMSERYDTRMREVSREAAAQGFGAVIVAPSPDLAYLTGYDPMPLERPTLLILRDGHPPALVVPELERPLAAGSPSGRLLGARGLDRRRRSLCPRGRPAAGGRTDRRQRPDVERAHPGPPVGRARCGVRPRIRHHRAAPFEEGRGRARRPPARGSRSRRDVPAHLRSPVPRAQGGRSRSGPGPDARRERTRPGGVHHRGQRPERRVAAP